MVGILSFSPTPPPIAPSQASAVGFNKLVFFDDFKSTSSIDLAKSGSNGFKWYIKFAWPNEAGVTGSAGDPWKTFADQSVSNISIPQFDPTALTSLTGAVTSKNNVASATYSATDPRGYVGNVFGPGGYFECSMKWTETAGFGSLAFYMFPIEFFTGSAQKFVEVDIFETTGATTGHTGLLPWDLSVVTPNNPEGQGPFVNFNTDPTNYHTFGCLWLTGAQNGGTGVLKFYVDNVEQTTVGPPAIPYSTNTTISSNMDNHHYVIMLSNDAPSCYYDFVRVWGP